MGGGHFLNQNKLVTFFLLKIIISLSLEIICNEKLQGEKNSLLEMTCF